MIDKILEALVADNNFAEKFRHKFDEIGPEVVTYSLNPDCDCKKDVRSFIGTHYNEILDFYTTYTSCRKNTSDEDTAREKTTGTLSADKGPRSLIGDVIEIAPDPSAYSDMIKHINTEGWVYNSISMMETEKTDISTGQIQSVWLAFFY